MKFSLERKIAAVFGVAIAVLLLIGGAAFWNARRFEETFSWINHTHNVLGRLERVMTDVLTIQSNVRGYVMTGSQPLLDSYHRHQEQLRLDLEQVKQLTSDNPVQNRWRNQLEIQLADVAAHLEARIAARQALGLEAVRDTTALQASQETVERVRSTIQAMLQEERRLLDERGTAALQAGRRTTNTAAVGSLVAIGFLVLSGWMLLRDTRQRQRVEESLRQSEKMFQRLFDNAPDAIIQVDRAGRIARANRQAEILFGWPRDELNGQPLEQLLPRRYHARHGGHLAAYFASPRARPMGAGLELFGRRKDDSEFPVDIMLSPLDTEEGPQALAVVRDITERKIADEKIRSLNRDLQLQNARLEIANKELESFSYSVSHDLRAPLRHIDGFASLLAKHAGPSLDEKSARFLGVISESARRMGRLVDDLLTFSRMGRAQMDLAEVDNNQLVAAVIRESAASLPRPVVWQIGPLPAVQADAAMLRQVWSNLIENALKYSSRAGTPRIEIGALDQPADSAEHVFYVRDNGVGFDMKYAAKLFGVFQRLHSETEFEGTGIGLANVRRIVIRHGGRTWAEGALGQGATFYFSLPVKAA